ncbi:MAG: hypothetical protein IKV40_04940, partial [Clostridia bacterium]|nr:hypothetical protein [Clostridia bacterium]
KISTVAYVGVLIYSDSAVTFDLSRVSVKSAELEDGEIGHLFEKKELTEEEPLPLLRIAAGALIVVITLIFTSVCIVRARRRDATLVNVVRKRRRR